MGLSDIANFLREVLRLNPTNEARDEQPLFITSETLEKLVEAGEITSAQLEVLKAHGRKSPTARENDLDTNTI